MHHACMQSPRRSVTHSCTAVAVGVVMAHSQFASQSQHSPHDPAVCAKITSNARSEVAHLGTAGQWGG